MTHFAAFSVGTAKRIQKKPPKQKLKRRNTDLEVPAKIVLLAKGQTSFSNGCGIETFSNTEDIRVLLWEHFKGFVTVCQSPHGGRRVSMSPVMEICF